MERNRRRHGGTTAIATASVAKQCIADDLVCIRRRSGKPNCRRTTAELTT